MSWRVPQKEHERVSETGVFQSLDRVSGTLCLSHYVTVISHLYSLRDFWRHFCFVCVGLQHIVTVAVAFLHRVQIFLLTYLLHFHNVLLLLQRWKNASLEIPKRHLKPRIHDAAGCTTGRTAGCTTGCIVYTQLKCLAAKEICQFAGLFLDLFLRDRSGQWYWCHCNFFERRFILGYRQRSFVE